MTRYAVLRDFDKERVIVAIYVKRVDFLDMSTAFALFPYALFGAREVVFNSCSEGEF
jgi:hypothetical protein